MYDAHHALLLRDKYQEQRDAGLEASSWQGGGALHSCGTPIVQHSSHAWLAWSCALHRSWQGLWERFSNTLSITEKKLSEIPFLAFTWDHWNQDLKKDTISLPCSPQHESQLPRCRNNFWCPYRWMDNCVHVQENIIQPWKKGNSLTCDSTYELCGHYAK